MILTRQLVSLPGGNDQLLSENQEGLCCYPIMGLLQQRWDRKQTLKLVFCSSVKIQQLLCGFKDSLGLHVPGVYKVPCSCEVCYIGQMEQTVLAQSMEHDRCILLKVSQINGHLWNTVEINHRALFDSVKVLVQVDNY